MQHPHLWPFTYLRKLLPGPGSGNLAFQQEALPEFTPIGPGIANRMQFATMTPATYVPHVIGIQGIGGLQNGQLFGSPLIVR